MHSHFPSSIAKPNSTSYSHSREQACTSPGVGERKQKSQGKLEGVSSGRIEWRILINLCHEGGDKRENAITPQQSTFRARQCGERSGTFTIWVGRQLLLPATLLWGTSRVIKLEPSAYSMMFSMKRYCFWMTRITLSRTALTMVRALSPRKPLATTSAGCAPPRLPRTTLPSLDSSQATRPPIIEPWVNSAIRFIKHS